MLSREMKLLKLLLWQIVLGSGLLLTTPTLMLIAGGPVGKRKLFDHHLSAQLLATGAPK